MTRKVTNTVAKIKLGLAEELRIGNLEAKRDWGYAGDYVKAMWLMLQQDIPEDFVIASGKTYAVKELCKVAFGHVGLDWKEFTVVDETFYRPAEVYELKGDASKAKAKLGWKSTMSFEDLIRTMVEEDIGRLEKQKIEIG